MDSLTEKLDNRDAGLYVTLLLISALTLWVFSEVIWTVFLAITLAYIFQPLNKKLQKKGFSSPQSSAIATLISFIGLLLLALPFALVLYQRRDILIDFLQDLPQSFELSAMGFEVTLQTTQLIDLTRDAVTDTAVNLAQATPSLALKFILVIVLLYAILRSTKSIETTAVQMVPKSMENILYRYHERIKEVLKGLYVVQASTAILTFVIGLPVFYLLGYEPFISLSLLAGIMQLIPVIGPTLLIIMLAGVEIVMGQVIAALTVFIIGLLLIALLPDMIVRPRLADWTMGLSSSIYLLGFIGGILTLGAIGIIVGPLIIALLLQTIELISEKQEGTL